MSVRIASAAFRGARLIFALFELRAWNDGGSLEKVRRGHAASGGTLDFKDRQGAVTGGHPYLIGKTGDNGARNRWLRQARRPDEPARNAGPARGHLRLVHDADTV